MVARHPHPHARSAPARRTTGRWILAAVLLLAAQAVMVLLFE